MFYSKEIRELLDSDDIVKLLVSAVPMLIKQNRIREKIDSVTLKAGNGLYAFPPYVSAEINGTERDLYLFELRPKELHYCLDAISGDTNLDLQGNREQIGRLYEEICLQLNNYNWNSVCKPSETFVVKNAV